MVIIVGEAGWALGAVLSRRLSLPKDKTITAGAEMLSGGVMLVAGSYACGELQPFPHVSLPAGLAILYLIVAGSLIGFTAFVWLLQRIPATQVSSHAYVNPVVALILGSWLGGELLTIRTLIGSALVLGSIVVIFLTRDPQPLTYPAPPAISSFKIKGSLWFVFRRRRACKLLCRTPAPTAHGFDFEAHHFLAKRHNRVPYAWPQIDSPSLPVHALHP